MKESDAASVTTFIRLKKEGFVPDRDVILALTADEEGGKSNGVDWLVKNHRDLIDAAFVLNADAGGLNTEKGKPVDLGVEATEKLYADFQLISTNPGGHSSLPKKDNAIYHMADALGKLEAYQFPFELNTVTRGYFEAMAKIETGQVGNDMRAVLKMPLTRLRWLDCQRVHCITPRCGRRAWRRWCRRVMRTTRCRSGRRRM